MTTILKKIVTSKISCDLCGLEIYGEPVVEVYGGEEKYFCCNGCARVYEIAASSGMLEQVLAKPDKKSEKITDLVFDSGETAYFSVQGMWCAGCAASAERVLRRTPGVKSVDVSFAAERGHLRYDPKLVDLDDLFNSLDSLGYKVRNLLDPAQEELEGNQERTLIQVIAAVAFGMQVMLLYLVQLYPRYVAGEINDPEVRKLQYLVWVLATPILLIGGYSFLRGAWRAFRARTATMDTLVALGTLSAYTYSAYACLRGGREVYFDSVAMITIFVMIGRYLETLGGAQARKDIRKLLKMQPDLAWRSFDGEWKRIKAGLLEPGDLILVKPGERVPADAQVTEGQAVLNEAMLTGESAPVTKGPGQTIYAGTLLTDEALVGRVLHVSQETRLAQITRLVDQTLSTKSPIQRLADRLSAWFAFGIVAAALLTFLGWWLGRGTLSEAVLAGVAVLVVACPCALGLATPLALAVSLGRTTQAGVLVRNPTALETGASIQRVAFDKTGTLTRGELNVVAVQAIRVGVGRQTDKELLRLAAVVEQYSEHPIARAVMQAYQAANGEKLPHASDLHTLRGLGTSARLEDGRRILVGSGKFLGVDGGASPLQEQAHGFAERGETVIWVGWGDQPEGMIILRDQPNPTAEAAVRIMKSHGIIPVLLSGDNPLTTNAIAKDLGITEYEGDCSPTEKAARVKSWQTLGQRVAMVGDGVNDAPALAQADLSVAMASGTDVAGETSDILLTQTDLTIIPWFFERSKRTRQIIQQNLGWAFAYNLLAVPLAAFGWISPIIAAVAMATSSLIVVGNSLRLRK